MNATPCYLNGEWLALEQARISPLDRGFLFGDGVYEVIPAYGGRAFQLAPHLERLYAGLAALEIDAGETDFAAIVHSLLADVDANLAVYLQVTRGAAERRDHRFPAAPLPTVFAYTMAMTAPVGVDEPGLAAISRDDIRWARCDLKTVSLLGNVLLRQAAEAQGVAETILLREGWVTEASASNLFAVFEHHTVVTPPLGPALLPGITRHLMLELARQEGMTVVERDIPAHSLVQARELWLTSSTKEMLPITRLDSHCIGDGAPGPVWRRLRLAFDRRKKAFREQRRTVGAGQ